MAPANNKSSQWAANGTWCQQVASYSATLKGLKFTRQKGVKVPSAELQTTIFSIFLFTVQAVRELTDRQKYDWRVSKTLEILPAARTASQGSWSPCLSSSFYCQLYTWYNHKGWLPEAPLPSQPLPKTQENTVTDLHRLACNTQDLLLSWGSPLTSHFTLKEKRALKANITQIIGQVIRPNQKIRDSASDEVLLPCADA